VFIPYIIYLQKYTFRTVKKIHVKTEFIALHAFRSFSEESCSWLFLTVIPENYANLGLFVKLGGRILGHFWPFFAIFGHFLGHFKNFLKNIDKIFAILPCLF